MNITSIFSFFFFIFILFDETFGKSGGGGGRGGGGRGSSGARGSFGSRGRSWGGGRFSSGQVFVRIHNNPLIFKVSRTSHTSFINYDSSAFRTNVFKPSTSKSYFSRSPTSTYVITSPSEPIIYDNHYYYWHGYYRSSPAKKTICEYTISDEDGELRNVTYSNGTTPKSIVFGCGNWEKCCGMTCCSSAGDWLALFILLFFISAAICYGCCKKDDNDDDDD